MRASHKPRAYAVIAILTIILGSLSGCRKAPINGDLDGQWQITRIEYPDGTIATPESKYICFSLHVVQLTTPGEPDIHGNMRYEGDTLTLDFPYDNTEERLLTLYQWGIASNPTTFHIVSLTSKNLFVATNHIKISCKKF